MTDIYDRLTEYCLHGGLYNPELMQHEKVRDLLIDCRAEIDRLRLAIRRLAEQDATLSVVGGNVIVEMDAAITDAGSLARMFHDEYERQAPNFGYETRPDTRTFDPLSPNGLLMIAVCRTVLERMRGPLVPFDPPMLRLTDEERLAVSAAVATAQEAVDKKLLGWENDAATASTLRDLLERTGGER